MRFTSIRPTASDWLGGNMNRCVVAVRGASTLLRRGLFLLILAGVPTTFGCGNEASSSAARPSPPPGPENQFRLRQALASPPGTNRGQLQSGEDCEAGGRAACRGGFCLHVGLRPDDHFVCAASCVSDDDCPDEWRCVPEGKQMYCAPPTGFRPHPVAVRLARQRPVVPTLRVSDAGVITCSPDGGACR